MSNSSDFQCFARVPLVLASQSPTSFSKFGRVRPRYRAVVEGRCTLFLSPAQWLHVYDVSRFVAKGDRLPSKSFLRTGMAASPNQPISVGGDLETNCNGLLPPLRVHAIRERRRGREQTSVVYVKRVGRGEKRRGKEKRNGVVGCWIWDC